MVYIGGMVLSQTPRWGILGYDRGFVIYTTIMNIMVYSFVIDNTVVHMRICLFVHGGVDLDRGYK